MRQISLNYFILEERCKLSPLLHCQWVDCAERQCKITEDFNLQYHNCDNIKSHIHYITLCQQTLLPYVLLGALGRSSYLKHLSLIKVFYVVYVKPKHLYLLLQVPLPQ